MCPELFGDVEMDKSIYSKYLKGCVSKSACWINPQFHIYRRSMGSTKVEKVIQYLNTMHLEIFFQYLSSTVLQPTDDIMKKDVQL